MNKEQPSVITYVPQQDERPASDMGTIRRGLWMYTHKLGLNFSLVLFLALAYQAFVAVFIALRGVRSLPLFARLPEETLPQVLGWVGALVVGFIIQGLIIAEMAQVVWLRHPDRLKVRLMSGSVWWWVMLIALIFTITVDFFLLFLSVTGTNNLGSAWQAVFSDDQMTIATTILLAVLNLLTLLRCASVMRTSTSEEIRQEVEERLKAIAEEILIDAGDSARQKAAQVWKKLSVNPQRFVPIHDSVLNLVSQQHPELIPPQLGGDTWAYDFNGNTFAVLPPDLHQALLQSRQRAGTSGKRKFMDEDQTHLWKLPPADLAEVITYNLETYGKPRFVDITEPEQPKFITRPVEFSSLFNPTTSNPAIAAAQPTQPAIPISNPPTQAVVQVQGEVVPAQNSTEITRFVSNLTPTEKALFGSYLTNTVFPHVHGARFPQLPDLNIFQVFDEVELQWYYRYWKKHTAQH
jgi:hypothetical protein